MLPSLRDLSLTKQIVLLTVEVDNDDLSAGISSKWKDMESLRINHWTLLEAPFWRKIRSLARRAAVNTDQGHHSEVDELQ